MSKKIESNKQTETQSAWLQVGVFISCLVLISLYLMGKLPLDALVAVLQLFSKLL